MRIALLRSLYIICLICPQNSWADKLYRVVILGDSITSGYQLQPQDAFPAKLQRKIHTAGYDRVEVINMGQDNATTASTLSYVDSVAGKLPDVIVVQLGFNDAKRGVPTTATGSNLNRIVATLKRTKAYVVLAGVIAPGGTSATYQRNVAYNFYNIAKLQKVPLLQNILAGIANNPYLTLADGMHPNTVGVDTMVENIFPLVDVGLRWKWTVYQQEISRQNNAEIPLLPPVVQ